MRDEVCKINSDILEIIDEALSYMQDFPHGVLYECLCRQKAMLLFENGKEEEAVAYLTESFGVTVRQRYLAPGTQQKTAPGTSQNDGRDVSLLRKLLEFGGPITPDAPLGYLNRLADLPSDWTIVQISQMDCGSPLLPPRSYPEKNKKTKPLVICRLGCGAHAGERQVRFVREPIPMPYRNNADILSELKNIVKLYTSIPTFGNVSAYMKTRNEVEMRYKTLLTSMQEWLAEHRCLLLGRIINPSLAKALETAVNKLAETFKVAKCSQQALSLLVQGCSVLSDKDLRNGLDALLPKGSGNRNKTLQNAANTVNAIAKTVMSQSNGSLTMTPRHHVILILDKALYNCTWEMLDVLRMQPASRVPCLAVTHAMHSCPNSRRQLDARSAYFVVDPDNNLTQTAKRMEPIVLARPSWHGTVRKAPPKYVLEQALRNQDIYLYCGHGTGMHLLPPIDKLQCNSVALLVGCSSSDLSRLGPFWEVHGAPINFMLSGSPATLGMLWDTLDRDADKLTLQLLESWIPPGVDNVAEYRKKLQELGMVYKNNFNGDTQLKDLNVALWMARQSSDCLFIAGAFVANGLPVSLGSPKTLKLK